MLYCVPWCPVRGNEFNDRLEREAWGIRLPSAYRDRLGPAPIIATGSREEAEAMALRIEYVLQEGEGYTRAERRRLWAMHRKWVRRACGFDSRYEIVGNRRGGLNKEERLLVALHAQANKMLEDATRERQRVRTARGDGEPLRVYSPGSKLQG